MLNQGLSIYQMSIKEKSLLLSILARNYYPIKLKIITNEENKLKYTNMFNLLEIHNEVFFENENTSPRNFLQKLFCSYF
jgi:hypothetical protein